MSRSHEATVALLVGLLACGGGDAAQKPAANLTGTWQITMTTGDNTCGTPAGSQEGYSAEIAHTAGSNSFALTGIGTGSVGGHIEGSRVTFAASVTTSECSPLAIQADGTLGSAGDGFSGKASYTCNHGSGTCSGSGTMSGARTGSTSSGPAAQLCARMLACGLIESIDQSSCQTALLGIEMYVVDAAQVSACLTAGTCQQVQDQTFLEQCLAYDVSSFRCSGSTLHFCNTSAQCADLSCDQGCRNYVPGTRSTSCGYDSQKAHDVCTCVL
jgi:hypothetical protein